MQQIINSNDLSITLNFTEDSQYTSNIAFIKALLIKNTIETLPVNQLEKENIRKEILQYLKNN